MDQAKFKDSLKQPDTHVSIAEHPSFTWQFAPVRAGGELPSMEAFKAIVVAKFNVVKLANCGGPANASKRGRGDDSDEPDHIPAKKMRVGAGLSQAVPSGKPGNRCTNPPRHWPGAARSQLPT